MELLNGMEVYNQVYAVTEEPVISEAMYWVMYIK